jgi:hypothetical protein
MPLLPEQFPGEKLLIRLWETVERFSIGMLSPMQIRREGLERAKVRRNELLIEAQARRDVHLIESGLAYLDEKGTVIPWQSPDDSVVAPAANERDLCKLARSRATQQSLRELINLRRVITHAEEEVLADDDAAPLSDDSISEDWLNSWRLGAEAVANEQMQRLWGRLLVGEVGNPGSFCLRTVHLLRTLSVDEARLVERIGRYLLDSSFVSRAIEATTSAGITQLDLLKLEELGILSGVQTNATNLTQTFKSHNINGTQRMAIVIPYLGRKVIVVTREEGAGFSYMTRSVLLVTRVGRELLSLGRFDPNDEYLLEAARTYIVGRGTIVEIGDFVVEGDASSRVPSNLVPVTPR